VFLGQIPTQAPVLVIVVSQPGCGHCEDYLPKFQRVAARYPELAMVHLNAADARPEMQAWMEQWKLESTPTTFIMRNSNRGGGVWKVEGDVDEAQIAQTLDFARSMNR
jgi:thiol-disulfide isomerase/thioredoxin